MLRLNMIIKLFLVMLLLTPGFTLASEIVLKSGEKLEGKIIEQTDKYVKFDAGVGVPMTYYNDEIDTVDGQKMQISSPIQEQKDVIVDNNPTFDGSAIISVGDKSIVAKDSIAEFNYLYQKPAIHMYYFSRALSSGEKDILKRDLEQKDYNGAYTENKIIKDYSVLELSLLFKNGSQVCTSDNLVGWLSEFIRKKVFDFDAGHDFGYPMALGHPPAPWLRQTLPDMGITKLSCSFEKGGIVELGLNYDQSSEEIQGQPPVEFKLEIDSNTKIISAKEIKNADQQINEPKVVNTTTSNDNYSSVKEKAPIIIPITTDDVLDTGSMDFTGPYLWFFSRNGRVPLTADWEELKTIARQMNPHIDLDKYTDVDITEQSDGSVKIKYRSKSKSEGSELTLPKPTPK